MAAHRFWFTPLGYHESWEYQLYTSPYTCNFTSLGTLGFHAHYALNQGPPFYLTLLEMRKEASDSFPANCPMIVQDVSGVLYVIWHTRLYHYNYSNIHAYVVCVSICLYNYSVKVYQQLVHDCQEFIWENALFWGVLFVELMAGEQIYQVR